MSVIRSEEQRPKLERMARHWPRSIQEYWRVEEERRGRVVDEHVHDDVHEPQQAAREEGEKTARGEEKRARRLRLSFARASPRT